MKADELTTSGRAQRAVDAEECARELLALCSFCRGEGFVGTGICQECRGKGHTSPE